MGIVVAFIASRLGVSSTIAGIVAIGVAVIAASGAAWGLYATIKHKGAEEVRDQIQKDNQDAIRKGIEASRSLDECIDAGGVWDFRRQRCSRATLGPR
ncbi:MAG: hypothetical protein EOS25_10270 [Mesorhizobium sp.]|nr:hypothetical protein [Mesorhizobium sp.]RWE63140.1 MAG: hypothetical protein EOS24_04975 [Mesorhizobium sp.]RWF10616.1 MAG: hypothetical protein EOS69_14395 [Mesorhizobium sp.]RWF19654.1 MAG: hypothetical protein EOS25_10270 [Mesorhizobium sp.]TIX99031.1 MAG: hypothetical protein E5V22_28240 [Mesorhizobium sp.]